MTLLMRLLQQHYAHIVDAALREAGFGDIRPGDAKVFPFVRPGGSPVGEIAALAGVRKQTMAEAVDQLTRGGYLERRPNPGDARSRLIFLTERGKAARPIAVTAGDRVEAHWAELTSPEEIESLRSRLLHLLQRIKQEHPDL
jgi:DNA-binding MarR family transcriptional regulator